MGEESAKGDRLVHPGNLVTSAPLSTAWSMSEGGYDLEKCRFTIYTQVKRGIRERIEMPADHHPEPSPKPRDRPAYPALLSCMTRGRAPSSREVDAVAARMWAELGHERRRPWNGLDPWDDRRRKVLAAARAAMAGGEEGESGLAVRFVLRGH